jgi:ribA/ribD-fused uncharacterized protein
MVEWRGILWTTSEHAYQAAKFEDPNIILKVQNARSAYEAKKVAHEHEESIKRDWDKIKIGIMKEIVREKLLQHPYIQRKLLETGDMKMVEDSPTDSFWGRGPDWNGENNLGKIWMKLREELRQKQNSGV